MRLRETGALVAAMGVAVLAACEQSSLPTSPGAGGLDGVAIATASGDNTLGTVAAVSGSGIVAGGVGLRSSSPSDITVSVPGGATVTYAFLYWEVRGDPADDSGNPTSLSVTQGATTTAITGTLIGHSIVPEGPDSRSYRADLLGAGLTFGTGSNTITVSGATASDPAFSGASLVIVYDDGSEAYVELRDGDDFAYLPYASPNNETVKQTFTFDAVGEPRTATLWLIVGDVESPRPNKVEVSVGGSPIAASPIINAFAAVDGNYWDTYSLPLTIPAGAGSVDVQLFSYDDSSGETPASLAWVVAGLDVPIPPRGGGEGCTPGYWKQRHHFDSWTGYAPGDLFSSVFEDAFPGKSLHDVLKQGGGGLKALGRHVVAALLNAASTGVSYDMTTGEVIDAFNDVYPGGDYEALKDELEDLNEQGCPLN